VVFLEKKKKKPLKPVKPVDFQALVMLEDGDIQTMDLFW
jgi:hypothetical protein